MANFKKIKNVKFNIGRVLSKNNRIVKRTMQRLADEMDVELQAKISVPVGITRGPRGGIIKIRSRPGEPPRRDKGFLRTNTEVFAKGRTVIVKTPRYGLVLDSKGGLNRPFLPKRDLKRWAKRAVAIAKELGR